MRSKNRGYSLIEVMVALSIWVVITMSLIMATTSSARIIRASRERDIATNAARKMVEEVRSYIDFSGIWVYYNPEVIPETGDPKVFEVEGLNTTKDLYGQPEPHGRIYFPTDYAGRLAEMPILLPAFRGNDYPEVVLEALDMNLNHPEGEPSLAEVVEGDYKILPVSAAVQWEGVAGPQRVVVTTVITTRNKYYD